MFTNSWLWIYAGVGLMLLELVVPGFVIIFFGLSAVTVGLLCFLIGDGFGGAWQWASFSVLAIAYLVLFRRYLKPVFVGGKVATATDFDHESVGRVATVVKPIDPPLAGRILLGDAEWNAVADAPIDSGASVRVVAQDNLTMKVEAI